ncbi:MAG: efflux RND transporter periplasmic adaptor subunit [Marinicella sp.]
MKNKSFIIIALIIVIAGAYWYYQQSQGQSLGGPGGYPGGNQVLKVSSIKVVEEPVTLKMALPGRTSAYKQSQVRPQVTGIIKERLFKEGAFVEKGQQLYQLDEAQYEANLKSAQANLLSAKANLKATQARFNRIKSLEKKQAVSQQDLDDAEAQLDQAKANISVAEAAVALEQINVDYTRVYAPIAGRIGKSNLTVGALVTASQTQALAVITQLNPIYVDMQVSGEQASWVQQQINTGAEITVELTGLNVDHPASGVLEFSDVNVNETTGSVGLRALMDNLEGTLLPGLFVNAEITLGERVGVMVPQRATTRTPDGELSVWVIGNNNQANPRIINVNRAVGDQWVVIGGLQNGDEIVVEGYQRLSPGAQVESSTWQNTTSTEPNRG